MIQAFYRGLTKLHPVALGEFDCVASAWDNGGNGVDVSAYDLILVSCQEDVHVAADSSADQYSGTTPAFLPAGSNWFYRGNHTHLHFKNVSEDSNVFLTGFVLAGQE